MKYTENYNLPLYEPNDLANLMDGYNESMNTLDDVMKTNIDIVDDYTGTVVQNKADIAANKKILDAEIARASERESELNINLANKIYNRTLPLHNFGAINLSDARFSETQNPQGMCLVNDYIICVLTNSKDKDDDIAVFIDSKTGVINKTVNVKWGHCNSISFNKADGYIYVTPTTSYEGAAENVIYKVSPSSLSTVETIALDVRPMNICFDNSTNACYICKYVSHTAIELYMLDLINKKTNLIGTFNPEISSAHGADVTYRTSGTQNIACYNGNLWFLMSGLCGNYVIKLNTQNANVENVLYFDSLSYIYGIREAESIDFTDDGDMVLYSIASVLNIEKSYANISFCNFYKGNVVERLTYEKSKGLTNAYVNETISTICKYGGSSKPFDSIYEAIAAVYYGYFRNVKLISDATIKSINMPDVNIYINLNSKTLYISDEITCNNLLIINGNLNYISKTLKAASYILSDLTIADTDQSLGFEYGILNTLRVSGGIFDGYNHTCLVKASTSTGTYSRFVIPTAK